MSKYFNTDGTGNSSLMNKYTNKYFQISNAVTEKQITNTENRLSSQGVSLPNSYDRSLLDRIISGVSATTYPIMGALSNITDSNPNTTAWQGVKEGFKSANPFGEAYEPGRKVFSDVLGNLGWESNDNPDGELLKPWTWDANNVAKSVAGFAGDVLLDPLTYLTLGTGALAKGTGKTIAGNSARELAKEGFVKGTAELAAKNFGKIDDMVRANKLTDVIPQGFHQDVYNKVIRDSAMEQTTKGVGVHVPFTNKYFNIVKPETMRKIGDNTVAPFINSAIEGISKSPVGDFLRKFQSTSKLANRTMARNTPDEYANQIVMGYKLNDLERTFKGLQATTAQHINDMFNNVSDETRITLTNLMETPDVHKFVSRMEQSINPMLNPTAKFKSYKDMLQNSIDDVSKTLDNYKAMGATQEKITAMEDIISKLNDVAGSGKIDFESIGKNIDGLDTLGGSYTDILNSYIGKSLNEIKDDLKALGDEESTRLSYMIKGAIDQRMSKMTKGEKETFVKDVMQKDVNNTGRYDDIVDDATGKVIGREYFGVKPHTPIDKDVMSPKNIDDVSREFMSLSREQKINKLAEHFAYNAGGEGKYFSSNKKRLYSDNKEVLPTFSGKTLKQDLVSKYEKMSNEELNNIYKQYKAEKQMEFDVTTKRTTVEDSRYVNKEYAVNENTVDEFRKTIKTKPKNSDEALLRKRYDNLISNGADSRELEQALRDIDIARNGEKKDIIREIANAKAKEKGITNSDIIYRTLKDKNYNAEELGRIANQYGLTPHIAIDGSEYSKEALEYLQSKGKFYPYSSELGELNNKVKDLENMINNGKYTMKTTPTIGNLKFKLNNTMKRIEEIEPLAEIEKFQMANAKKSTVENMFEGESLHALHDVNGTKIYQKAGNNNTFRADDFITAIRDSYKGGSRGQNSLKELWHDITVRITDIDNWSNAGTIGNDIITTGKDLGKYFKKNIIDHEFGHNFASKVYDQLFSKTYKNQELKDGLWTQIIKGEGTIGKLINSDPTSKFIQEDFAESFVKYINNPKVLRRDFPQRFEAIHNAIKNFSYKGSTNTGYVNKYFDQNALKEATKTKEGMTRAHSKLASDINSNTLTESEAIKAFSALNDLSDNATESFRKAYDNEAPYDITNEIERKSLELDRVKAKELYPNLSDDDLDLAQEMKNMLYDYGKKENINGVDESILTYMPHMQSRKLKDGVTKELTPEDIAKAKESGFDPKHNVYNQSRKLDGTIEKINKFYKDKLKVDNYFETNAARIMLNRGLKHNQFVFNESYYNTVLDNFGKEVGKITDIGVGQKVYASTERIKELLKANIDNADIEAIKKTIGLPSNFDKVFRPMIELDSKAFAEIQRLDNTFKATSLPTSVVEQINKAGKLSIEQNLNPMMQIYDKFLSLWKVNATAITPGFHIRNAMSNMFNNYLNIGTEVLNPKTNYQAIKLLGNDTEYLSKTFIKTANGEKSLLEVQQQMNRLQVASPLKNPNGTGAFDEPFSDMSRQNVDEAGNFTRRKMESGDTKFDWNSLNPLSPIVDVNQPLVKSLMTPANEMVNKQFLPYELGRKAGTAVEGQARALNFLANVKQGKGYMEAADNTNKYLFDYFDLSDMERKVMKRAVPFYTWMRKNIPLQVEHLFKQPEAYKKYAFAKDEIENNVSDEDKLNPKYKSPYAQDMIQTPFTQTTKDKKGKDVKTPQLINMSLPLQDLGKLPIPSNSPLKQLITSATPALKIPLELAANKNFYFDSPISQGITDKTNAPGYVQALQGGTKEKPITMSPEERYVLQSLTPSLENIGKLIDPTKDEKNIMLNMMKVLAGQSITNYNEGTYKKYAMQSRMRVLKDLKKQLDDAKKDE